MSIHEGKKIVRALDAFNKNKLVQADVSSLLAIGLRSGRIQKRHIDKLEDVLIKEIDRLPAHFGIERVTTDEGINFISYGHMVINSDVDGTFLYDHYTPRIVTYVILPKKFLRHEVVLPIRFHSQRTEFRFIQHTAQTLDYKSDEFFSSMISASVMMQALTHGKISTPDKPVPMFVPHNEGLFLGFAEPMPPDTYRRQFDHVYLRGKRVISEHLIARDYAQPFVPTMRMVIKTFVPAYDMNPEKRTIWEKLRAIFKDPMLNVAMQTSFNGFLTEVPPLDDEKNESVQKLFDAFHEVMETKQWAWLTRSSLEKGHTPNIGYAERLSSLNIQSPSPRAA